MTSPARSFARDEASVTSPFRNAFASSSTTKPSHSPYLKRRSYTSNDSPYTGYDTQSKTSRPPDAISTSSSTLVNAESTSDYRPWEVRSESSTISLDSATISRGGRATPTLSALDEIGTLPSIHISPLPNRAARVNRQQAQSRNGGQLGRRSLDSSRTRARIVRQLCPDDCRCSDQDINLGLCRRVVGSSSSSSDSGSLSVGVHPTRARASNTSTDLEADMPPNAILNNLADHSRQSSHSQSESRSQGRDFDKDPILVPRSSRTKPASRSAVSNYQHSFDQLQRGLDELESSESDVETNADQVLAAQRRAESMARWTARRASLSRSSIDGRSTELKPEQPPEAPKDSPVRSTRYMASDVPLLRHTSESKTVEDNTSLSIPLKATPGRKSIAAVFESMQKEREVRAAEEHKRWQEKQARRERERAARAFGASLRRRTSASSSQFDSPASGGTSAFDTPSSQNNSNTTYRSMVSRATPHPSRSPVSSLGNASPLHSSPNPPKVDESAASDHVETRHLGEEAATWVLETLAEDEEQVSNDQDSDAQPEAVDITEETQEDEAFQTTPQTKQASAFAFTPQPMTLDLSPVRSVSDFSSPASSPRKNAHRRQNTNTVSVAARIPPASLGAARQRLNQVLRSSPDESSRIQPLTTSAEVEQQSHRELAQRIGYDNPQTPVNGILSSARKGLPQFSAARRGHSVRFSPRPDYRSDSGSWDESGTQSNGGENSREAAVESRLLPAKEIVIPEILAGASKPLQVSAGTDADMVEVAAVEVEEEDKGLTERFVEQVHRVSPAKSERMESISKPHTVPALAQLQDVSSTSTSQSVRFPGSYVTTPVKKYSRHVIRPSPKTPRTSNVHPSVAASRAPLFAERMSAAEEFGLFPAAGSRGSDIPRESTPPPPQQSRQNRLMGADDPHSFSPRSPRPADLGTRQFGQFHTGSSSDDSAPFQVIYFLVHP
uniref:Uncharacterized protein n=1 Tax=Melanopsichium pennsylvanicum 4 TaxID=1398559 RepID=A0A077QQL1_9BASI|nr:putative protein [Melanopsichium pennsylvanicum 4]